MATQVGKPEKDENREDISVQIMMLSHRKALERCSARTKALLHPCAGPEEPFAPRKVFSLPWVTTNGKSVPLCSDLALVPVAQLGTAGRPTAGAGGCPRACNLK